MFTRLKTKWIVLFIYTSAAKNPTVLDRLFSFIVPKLCLSIYLSSYCLLSITDLIDLPE